MWLVLSSRLLIFTFLCRRLYATEPRRMWPKVVLFGDSITQYSFCNSGWGAALADKLQRRCDVQNRGISGYNSRWGRIILPQIITKETASSVAMVIIFFGANDASLPDINPKQHVPVSKYRNYLQEMITFLTSVDISKEKIILISPPPVDEKAWAKECSAKGSLLNRNNSVTGKYSAACCEVAEENNVECINLWTSMQEEQNWSRFLQDGLHLSPEGSLFLEEKLTPKVVKKMEYLQLQFPYWADVDHHDPEQSLLNYDPYCTRI